jgi:hypothetical protein
VAVGIDRSRRDMSQLGKAIEHRGDAEIAHGHQRRLPYAEILGMDQAGGRQDRARERKRRGLLSS